MAVRSLDAMVLQAVNRAAAISLMRLLLHGSGKAVALLRQFGETGIGSLVSFRVCSVKNDALCHFLQNS